MKNIISIIVVIITIMLALSPFEYLIQSGETVMNYSNFADAAREAANYINVEEVRTTKINEIAFAKAFIIKHRLVYCNAQFYSDNGITSEAAVKNLVCSTFLVLRRPQVDISSRNFRFTSPYYFQNAVFWCFWSSNIKRRKPLCIKGFRLFSEYSRAVGNRVTVKSGSRVRIPCSPPNNQFTRQGGLIFLK